MNYSLHNTHFCSFHIGLATYIVIYFNYYLFMAHLHIIINVHNQEWNLKFYKPIKYYKSIGLTLIKLGAWIRWILILYKFKHCSICKGFVRIQVKIIFIKLYTTITGIIRMLIISGKPYRLLMDSLSLCMRLKR